jgi:molybdopterin converting factor small subunit
MAVRVEFFGIARQRAGTSQLALDLSGEEITFGAVLERLAGALPNFAGECLAGDRLQPSLAANLDGRQFISDPAATIRDGQCLLILSADAGG